MPFRIINKSTGDTENNAAAKMTRWHGITIARHHALLPAVRDIATHQSYNDLTTVSVVGREGTGKSNLIAVISHYLHEELARRGAGKVAGMSAEAKLSLEKPYGVFWFTDSDLINFQHTVDSLPAVNRILVFDDVSFISGGLSRKDLDKIKKALTVIRHGLTADYRTIIFYSWHYSRGLDKYIRDTNMRFVTSVGAEEIDNYADFFGRSNTRILQHYKKTSALFTRGRSVKIKVGTGATARALTYRYRDPFGLALYHDGDHLRWCVYPGYDLVVPSSCVHCVHPDQRRRQAPLRMKESDYHKIHAFVSHHCGQAVAAQAARLMGFQRYGRPMYLSGTGLKRAVEIFRRLDRDQSFSLDDYLNYMLPAKLPRKDGKIAPKWSTYVSREIQEDYKEKFSVDALRPMGDT